MKLLTILSISFTIILLIDCKLIDNEQKKVVNPQTQKNLIGIEDVKKIMAEKDAKLKLLRNRQNCGNRRKRHYFRCGSSPGAAAGGYGDAGGGGGGWDSATSQSFNIALLFLVPLVTLISKSY